MLFDTYGKPTIFGKTYRFLYLVDFAIQPNTQINVIKKVLSASSSFDNTGFRCDMHPRWLDSGNMFSVDLIKNNYREISIGKI